MTLVCARRPSAASPRCSPRRSGTSIRADAEHTFGSLAGARADRAGLRAPSEEETAANPAARTAYQEHKGAADRRIEQLQAAWDGQAVSAAGVNTRVLEAAQQAGRTIRAAGRSSPTASQSWLEMPGRRASASCRAGWTTSRASSPSTPR
jgi:hypothetical protein